MKKYLLFISILVSICSFAQTPSGSKTRYPGVWFSSKDTATNATTADSIAILVNRADSSLRWRYSVTAPWKKVLTSYDNDFIRNQTGSNLSAQTAKFYVTDTVKTDGKVIASGVSGLSASSSVGVIGVNSSTGRAMSATSLSGEAIIASNNSTTSPTISVNQFGSSNIAELLNGYGFGVKIDTSGSIIMSNNKSSAYTGKISIPFLNANRTYTLPDASGTLALTSDIPVSGTFTNRRIPFANSSGQLKDTTGFTWAAQTLSVPGVIEAYGNIYTIGTGKGYYGQYLDIEDNVTNSIAIIYNSNANGGGAAIQGGNNLNKPTLKLFGYSGDSIANFNPLGVYFYKGINGTNANFSSTGNLITNNSAGTNAATIYLQNTANRNYYGINNNEGNYISGASANATVLWNVDNVPIEMGVNGSKVVSHTSTQTDFLNVTKFANQVWLTNNSSNISTILAGRYTNPSASFTYTQMNAENTTGYQKFYTSDVLRMTIDGSGNIGAPSGTNIYSASDARLKKNIQPIQRGLSAVMLMNPVSYNWIDSFAVSERDKTMLGFVAQEMLNAVPEAVENYGGGDTLKVGETIKIPNPKRINEKFLIPVLVKAIQELKADNDNKQAQIDDLKTRILNIEAILQRNNIK